MRCAQPECVRQPFYSDQEVVTEAAVGPAHHSLLWRCRTWEQQLESKRQAKVDEATEATEAAAAWLVQLRKLQDAEVHLAKSRCHNGVPNTCQLHACSWKHA